jgi:hypothetical protein
LPVGGEAEVCPRGPSDIRARRFFPPKAEAPDADACKHIAGKLGDDSFMALVAMRDEIPEFPETGPSMMPLALTKEEPIEVVDAGLS